MAAGGSSFYWAMRLLRRRQRRAVFALYDFCCLLDDIADVGEAPAVERLAALDFWRAEIAALYAGAPTRPPTRALVPALRDYGLERRDLLAVVDGVAMDVQGEMRRPSQAALDLYCDRVAGAVGRLSMRIFGAPGPDGAALAAVLGRALQLTNILRDLGEDAGLGRLYLPDELLARHGIESDAPARVLEHPALAAVCDALADMAWADYDRAWAMMRQGDQRVMRAPGLMAVGYQALLGELRRRRWPRHRLRLAAPRKAWLVLRYLARGAPSAGGYASSR